MIPYNFSGIQPFFQYQPVSQIYALDLFHAFCY